MLPLLVVGGIIGAVVSAVQGGSWLSDKVDASSSSASVGGKASAKPATEAKASPFEAALAAQVAGQSVPVSAPAPASVPVLHGPDQDALARMNAGMVAYNHIGEHRSHHPKSQQGAGDVLPAAHS